MRTYEDIKAMAAQDYDIGLTAHYKPLAELVNERGYKSVIEIGTAYGGNSYYMLSNTKIEHLMTIDPYIYYPAMPGFICQEEYDALREFALQKLLDYWGRVELLRLTSKEAFRILEPVDLIFLDGSHDYQDVKWECENYGKLVLPGGVLSGHDYNIFEGVNKAVDEFSKEIGKEVKLLPGNIWYMEF